MNCKQGDLAVVVKAPKQFQELIGRIYTCVVPVTNRFGEPAWITDRLIETSFGDVGAIEDKYLKPLDAPLNDDELIDNKELENVE